MTLHTRNGEIIPKLARDSHRAAESRKTPLLARSPTIFRRDRKRHWSIICSLNSFVLSMRGTNASSCRLDPARARVSSRRIFSFADFRVITCGRRDGGIIVGYLVFCVTNFSASDWFSWNFVSDPTKRFSHVTNNKYPWNQRDTCNLSFQSAFPHYFHVTLILRLFIEQCSGYFRGVLDRLQVSLLLG